LIRIPSCQTHYILAVAIDRSRAMAKVTVRMFATVREASGTDSIELEAESVSEALSILGRKLGPLVKKLLAGFDSEPEKIVILINGKNPGYSRALSRILSDGDEIALFPPVSGG
jgi:molybdopterin synthase sulfur carrier subunit